MTSAAERTVFVVDDDAAALDSLVMLLRSDGLNPSGFSSATSFLEALTPETLNAASDGALRAAGLSANKLASLRDLSAKVLDGTVVLSRTSRRDDEELIERLSAVRGIGRWTAEMYLMFQLRRLDVWPVDDLGIRQGYALAWNIDPPPTPKQLEPLGDRFSPYRSVVARYCWAAVPLLRPGGTSVSLR